MIKHYFRDVVEHDIDMLILEEFSCSSKFCKIFLSKVGVDEAKLISTWQSKTDPELGESDMTVIFYSENKKIALLIEDKIDAIAMPEQPLRYTLRGNKGITCNEYDSFYVFIVAPKNYLDNNEKAKEYPYKVSYEEIQEYFENILDARKSFKLSQINLAIEKQKKGYQIIKNSLVTDFWNKYIEYQKEHYPELKLIINSNIKPTSGVWTQYRTDNSNICICYKSNKGNVDLTFNGKTQEIEYVKTLLSSLIGDYYEQGLSVVKTGKSCAIRLRVPIVDFSKPFENQLESIIKSFNAVNMLNKLFYKLDIAGICRIYELNN